MSRPSVTGFAIMGMKCFFCKKDAGNLMIPRDKIALEALAYLLTDLGIVAQCEDCHNKDPYFVPAEEVKKQS